MPRIPPSWRAVLVGMLQKPMTRSGVCRSSASVTIPAGLLRFRTHASGARRSTTRAIPTTAGTVRSAQTKPPAPVVSLPTMPSDIGRASSRLRAARPPTLICGITKSAPSTARSRSVVVVSRIGDPAASRIRLATSAMNARRSALRSTSATSSTDMLRTPAVRLANSSGV